VSVCQLPGAGLVPRSLAAAWPCSPVVMAGQGTAGCWAGAWQLRQSPSSWARGVRNRLTGYLTPSTETTPGCWACPRMARSWCGGRSETVGWPWPKDSPWWLSRSLAALGWRRWVQQLKEGWFGKTTLNSGAHVAELALHMCRARKSPFWTLALILERRLLSHTDIPLWKTGNSQGFAMLWREAAGMENLLTVLIHLAPLAGRWCRGGRLSRATNSTAGAHCAARRAPAGWSVLL